MNRYKGSLTIEQLIVAHEKIKANAMYCYELIPLPVKNGRMNLFRTWPLYAKKTSLHTAERQLLDSKRHPLEAT